MFSAKIIKDSVNVTGQRLTTLQLVYPRIIHGEFLTHRVFSRNSSSSRAIPVAKVIAQVRDNPAMPVHWGKNQPGMQAFQEVEDTAEAERLWRRAANDAANIAQAMLNLGLHKQVPNRLLEPFQWMHTVVSATEFDNWFALRDHKDAEPNIRYLAQLMRIALDDSTPTLLHHGDWHLPYIKDDENLTLEVALKASAARCARVSYLTHDGHTPDVAKDIELFNRLVGSTPKHCFSGDTEVLTTSGFKLWPDVTEADTLADVDINTGTLVGWGKPLELIKHAFTGNMYSVDGHGVSFDVTDGHKMLGHLVSDSKSRYAPLSLTPYVVGATTSPRHSKRTLGEVEARMLTSPIVDRPLSAHGKLIGMYIGDGFKVDTSIAFHLKRPRKIEYLTSVLRELGLGHSVRITGAGTTHIRVYKCSTTDAILRECGSGSRNKRLGSWGLEDIPGIFDGLKNSDGSVKRNTWSYGTTSEALSEDLMGAAPLAGLTIYTNKTQRGLYKLMVQTTNLCRVNDSRNMETSGVSIRQVKNVDVYCATMPSGALVVRRNGKTLVTGNCSPIEHQATPFNGVFGTTGNFTGWTQHRKLWEQAV